MTTDHDTTIRNPGALIDDLPEPTRTLTREYLSAIGKRGGQTSRRSIDTAAQARMQLGRVNLSPAKRREAELLLLEERILAADNAVREARAREREFSGKGLTLLAARESQAALAALQESTELRRQLDRARSEALGSLAAGLSVYAEGAAGLAGGDLRNAARDMRGDVAGVGKNLLMLTPAGVRIDRNKIRGAF